MMVTIEGVVQSDVCDQGARHTVEWTEHLRSLVRSGLIRVIDWHHDAPQPVAAKPRRRGRRRAEP